LRADPDSVSDHAPTIKPALNDCLLADENAVSDLERLRVNNGYVLADIRTCPELLDEGPKTNSPHHHIDRPSSVGVMREGFHQLLATELLPQMLGHIEFELRIRLDLAQAMDRLNDAGAALSRAVRLDTSRLKGHRTFSAILLFCFSWIGFPCSLIE
jgi:hypothetical protein